jgi:hypothetical protein
VAAAAAQVILTLGKILRLLGVVVLMLQLALVVLGMGTLVEVGVVGTPPLEVLLEPGVLWHQ